MIEKTLRLNQIKIPKSRIRTSVEKNADMERLVDSIKKLGLFHPILIDEDYNLIAGFRRLTAYKQLNLEDPVRFGTISVRIMPKVNRAKALEAEIHENWTRKQLRGYELDTALAELKTIYQAIHPETKRGAHLKETRKIGGKKAPTLAEIGESAVSRRVKAPRFAESMSKTLNVKESTIEKRTRVGEAIIEGKFDADVVEEYKLGIKGHTEMLKIFQEEKKAKKKALEKKEDVTPLMDEISETFGGVSLEQDSGGEKELDPLDYYNDRNIRLDPDSKPPEPNGGRLTTIGHLISYKSSEPKTQTISEAIEDLDKYAEKKKAEIKKRNEDDYREFPPFVPEPEVNPSKIYNEGYIAGYNQAVKDVIYDVEDLSSSLGELGDSKLISDLLDKWKGLD